MAQATRNANSSIAKKDLLMNSQLDVIDSKTLEDAITNLR